MNKLVNKKINQSLKEHVRDYLNINKACKVGKILPRNKQCSN